MGIIVEKTESAGKLNTLLHEYGDYMIGRMGGSPYGSVGDQYYFSMS